MYTPLLPSNTFKGLLSRFSASVTVTGTESLNVAICVNSLGGLNFATGLVCADADRETIKRTMQDKNLSCFIVYGCVIMETKLQKENCFNIALTRLSNQVVVYRTKALCSASKKIRNYNWPRLSSMILIFVSASAFFFCSSANTSGRALATNFSLPSFFSTETRKPFR